MITIVFPIMYYHNITNQVCGACHRKWDQVVRLESSNALELNQVFVHAGVSVGHTLVLHRFSSHWVKRKEIG